MLRRVVGVAAVAAATALTGPAAAGAASGWVPGSDEVAPAQNMRTPAAVITPDRRTAVFWVNYPAIRGAVRQPGGTFGDPFELDGGNSAYVPQFLNAVALPSGEVLAAWSSSIDDEMRVKSLKPDGTITSVGPLEAGASQPVLAANAQGTVVVAYYWYNEVHVAIRQAGATTLDAPILLASLVGNEHKGGLDATLRADGQIAVAIGTDVANPPGGTARMLIARRSGGTTTVETADSRALTLSQPPGSSQSALFRPAMELLADGRQMLVYRLETVNSGSYTRELHGGPRDGTGGAVPLLDQTFGATLGAKEHDLVVDDAGRPWIWWRHGTAGGDDLRVRQATTAGAFSAPLQVLATPVPGTVALEPFGAGRTGVLFTQSGKVKASTSEAGGAFGAPVDVATPGAVPVAPASVALAGADEGSGVAVWPDGVAYTSSALHATPFDATAPTLPDLQAPASLTAGVAGTFAATARDDWSVPSVSWLFSDGATLLGASVQHAFPAAGSFTATATATDAVGNTATGARNVAVSPAPSSSGTGTTDTPSGTTQPTGSQPAIPLLADTRAPGLSGVRFSPAALRRGVRKTTLRFRVDEAATVVAQLERARPGFRSGARCVARRPRTGTPKRCTRYVRSGAALRRVLAAAATGQLTIKRPAATGGYRVRVRATDAAGNRSTERRAALAVR